MDDIHDFDNTVVAVLSHEATVDEVSAALSAAGYEVEILKGDEGKAHLDAAGQTGAVATIKRLVDAFGDRFRVAEKLERELEKGNVVICNFCGGLGFKGRTGIYEIFAIDDEVRQMIAAGGQINQLKMLFKKQRRRYIQEIAVLQAVQGETSLQEVARVLRVSDAPEKTSSSAPAPSGAARPSSSSPRRAAPSSGA